MQTAARSLALAQGIAYAEKRETTRVATMSDTFRRAYRELTETEALRLDEIKRAAESLETLIYGIVGNKGRLPGTQGRLIALALTKLEECVMWAVKAAT
jgi:hypothetical protein